MKVIIIGRILIIEFTEHNSSAFDKIVDVLKKYSDFEYLRLEDEPVISLPRLEIYPRPRKVYNKSKEIKLTAKEYEILALLVANKDRVLTYGQIYQKVWGEESFGRENTRKKKYYITAAWETEPFLFLFIIVHSRQIIHVQ